MKFEGREVVKAVSETEKIDEVSSTILKIEPEDRLPFGPICNLKRSPVVVTADPGAHDKLARTPSPVVAVAAKAVEAVEISSKVPEVKVLPEVASCIKLPVVNSSAVTYMPVPALISAASKTKAEVVVVPVSTREVWVWAPVPELNAKAVAPVALPIVIVLALAPVPILIAPVEFESIAKAPAELTIV